MTNWIGHFFCRNCLLKHVTKRKIKGSIELAQDEEECLNSYWMTLREIQDTGN
jgi:hypothetical protein